jgi:glycine/D-amino acid oxidase-like deaminating enzyme
VSKVVRADYGADELYTREMEEGLEGWLRWNAELGETLFHETGAMFLTRAPMAPGGFEHESFVTLTGRGHALERLDAKSIEARSSLRGFVDGYFNPRDGWADSSRVVERLSALAQSLGVVVRAGVRVTRASGDLVTLEDDVTVQSDAVVVAAGGWTGDLVPDIAGCFHTVGQPVFHVEAKAPLSLTVCGADLGQTGWYGFPARDGFVKIAHHGPGRAMHPSSSARVVSEREQAEARDVLRSALPTLADAPFVKTRVCVYCDTHDGHFWIAPHPGDGRLVVATGGSGHAFKFAPRIGEWIARALEGDVVPRFRWREDVSPGGGDAARVKAERA